ncbi:MAG: hypothetical protein WBC63_06705 [Candidatus Bipolaricaulia bacterium]
MAKRILVGAAMLLALASVIAVPQVTVWTEITQANITEETDGGLIDWTQGFILVTGMAVAPLDAQSEAHGKLMAREAALAVAQLRLAEMLEGVRVLGVTAVRNLILDEAVLETVVEGQVKMAQIVPELEEWIIPRERFLFFFSRPGDWRNGEYHVTIQYNLLGEFPVTILPYAIAPPAISESQDFETTPFSGLIINALGTPLRTTLFVRLVDPNESEVGVVRGAAYVPSAGYELSLGQLSVERAEQDPRVGAAPLTIDVLGVGEDGYSLIISQSAADLVRQMEATSDILAPQSDRVIVVLDSAQR